MGGISACEQLCMSTCILYTNVYLCSHLHVTVNVHTYERMGVPTVAYVCMSLGRSCKMSA